MMETYLLYIFSALTVAFSLAVIFMKNPVSSALSLVASFFCVSALFILMHATFLGVVQVLIYAGAILVLFLFVLMLLNLQEENWIFTHAWDWKRSLQALSIVGILVYLIFSKVIDIPAITTAVELDESFGNISSVGEELLGKYVLAFEWVSVLLFAGILGVIGIASKKAPTSESKKEGGA